MRFKLLVVFVVLTVCAATHGQMVQQIQGGDWKHNIFRPHKWPLLIFGERETTTQSGARNGTTLSSNSTTAIPTTTDSIKTTMTSTKNPKLNVTFDAPEASNDEAPMNVE